ncbi:MAG: hypothetical protein ACR2QE_17985 [Acidimicrobiales bacterium]
MNTRNVLIALAVIVVAAVATALLYDSPEPGPTAAEAALISALADDLATVEPGDPAVALDDEQAQCVAEDMVSRIGGTRLTVLGVDAASVRQTGFAPAEVAFLEEERVAVVDALSGCVDLTELAVDSLALARGQAARSCVRDALAGPLARELWLWRVGPATDEAPAALAEALSTIDDCLG